jgi:hypothetical protein
LSSKQLIKKLQKSKKSVFFHFGVSIFAEMGLNYNIVHKSQTFIESGRMGNLKKKRRKKIAKHKRKKQLKLLRHKKK